MALEIDVISTTGLSVEKAYFKIDDYSCDKSNTVRARLRAYVSRELEKEGHEPIEGTEKIFTIEGDYSQSSSNVKVQVYDFVKTLPDYEYTTDVFE